LQIHAPSALTERRYRAFAEISNGILSPLKDGNTPKKCNRGQNMPKTAPEWVLRVFFDSKVDKTITRMRFSVRKSRFFFAENLDSGRNNLISAINNPDSLTENPDSLAENPDCGIKNLD
jgi:hypothetical protein